VTWSGPPSRWISLRTGGPSPRPGEAVDRGGVAWGRGTGPPFPPVARSLATFNSLSAGRFRRSNGVRVPPGHEGLRPPRRPRGRAGQRLWSVCSKRRARRTKASGMCLTAGRRVRQWPTNRREGWETRGGRSASGWCVLRGATRQQSHGKRLLSPFWGWGRVMVACYHGDILKSGPDITEMVSA
jgi:hypothetical protein